MHLVFALLLLLHGIAHLPGFAVTWRMTASNEMPYKTTLLGGRVDVGDAGMRVMGLLWLAGALAFVVAAVMTWRASPGWPTLTLVVTLVSLVLSVLAWPDSRIGVAVNVAIVALLLVGGKAGWFPASR